MDRGLCQVVLARPTDTALYPILVHGLADSRPRFLQAPPRG